MKKMTRRDECFYVYFTNWYGDYYAKVEKMHKRGWPMSEAEESAMFEVGPMASELEFFEMKWGQS